MIPRGQILFDLFRQMNILPSADKGEGQWVIKFKTLCTLQYSFCILFKSDLDIKISAEWLPGVLVYTVGSPHGLAPGRGDGRGVERGQPLHHLLHLRQHLVTH